MKSIEVENVGTVTYMMFAQDAFDGLLLVEANMNVLVNYSIDGRINQSFLEEEDKEDFRYQNEYAYWGDIRKFCYDIIKGRKVPVGLKCVFKLAKENVPDFIKRNGISGVKEEDIKGLFINIKYENEKLTCVTCTSLATFDLKDKRVDEAWDYEIERFISQIDHQ